MPELISPPSLAAYALLVMQVGLTSFGGGVSGWQAGLQGAVVATLAIFLPSSLLLYLLARIWARYRGRPSQRAVERGLAPIAAGLILAAALTVLQAAQGGWRAWAVAGTATIVLTLSRVSPFLLLGAGALVFLLTT